MEYNTGDYCALWHLESPHQVLQYTFDKDNRRLIDVDGLPRFMALLQLQSDYQHSFLKPFSETHFTCLGLSLLCEFIWLLSNV